MDTTTNDPVTSGMADPAQTQSATNAANPASTQTSSGAASPAVSSGSGQSGSGTVPGSTTATAEVVPAAQREEPTSSVTSGGVEQQFDHLVLQAGSLAAIGATAETAIEAALGTNQSPAPTDPVLQQIAAIESRVTSVETIVNATTPPEYHARLLALEETVAALIKLAEEAAPWWTKIVHLFDVHFSGKVNPPA